MDYNDLKILSIPIHQSIESNWLGHVVVWMLYFVFCILRSREFRCMYFVFYGMG